jgi:hypothetical protein
LYTFLFSGGRCERERERDRERERQREREGGFTLHGVLNLEKKSLFKTVQILVNSDPVKISGRLHGMAVEI